MKINNDIYDRDKPCLNTVKYKTGDFTVRAKPCGITNMDKP
jgi:hypothetical protein